MNNTILSFIFIITLAFTNSTPINHDSNDEDNSKSLIGYDCSTKQPNITTISLLQVDQCNYNDNNVTYTNITIDLFQLSEVKRLKTIHCKLEIFRSVRNCGGLFNYVKPEENPDINYIQELSYETCVEIHKNKVFFYNSWTQLSNLKINSTTSIPVTFSGSAKFSKCVGNLYKDPWGTYYDALVQGYIKLTLAESYADLDIKNNIIHLKSGTACALTLN